MGVKYFFIKFKDIKFGPYLIYKDKDVEIFNELIKEKSYNDILYCDEKKYKKNESILLNDIINNISKKLKEFIKKDEYENYFKISILKEYYEKNYEYFKVNKDNIKYNDIYEIFPKELYILSLKYFISWLEKEKKITFKEYSSNEKYHYVMENEFFEDCLYLKIDTRNFS